MQTAVYLANRVPHASLGETTVYKCFSSKEANLEYLRVIDARAFVHVETYMKNLDPQA